MILKVTAIEHVKVFPHVAGIAHAGREFYDFQQARGGGGERAKN